MNCEDFSEIRCSITTIKVLLLLYDQHNSQGGNKQLNKAHGKIL